MPVFLMSCMDNGCILKRLTPQSAHLALKNGSQTKTMASPLPGYVIFHYHDFGIRSINM